MPTDSTFKFPSPVGGAPLSIDFAPAIVFAVLYGLLLPVVIYRMVNRSSRNLVLLGTCGFAAERVVAYALRANAAHSATAAEPSAHLVGYLQTTLNIGFICVANDVCTLLRSLLVSTTFATPTAPGDAQQAVEESQANAIDENAPKKREGRMALFSAAPTLNEGEDRPRLRFWLRQVFGITSLGLLAAMALGIVAAISYSSAVENGSKVTMIARVRYVSTVLTFVFVYVLQGTGLYALYALPRVPRWPVWYLMLVLSLLSVICHYRVVVLLNWTTSLGATTSHSGNTPGEKAAFWVFHVAPEWLAATLHVAVDVRKIYKTHWFGDLNSSKPLPP